MNAILLATATCLVALYRHRRGEDRLAKHTKRVHLVGAGPGDPGLLTTRGREVLAEADVVLTDRLVSLEILAIASRNGARIINVGKSSEKNRFPQTEVETELINAIRECREGGVVVRLKGGDPFVFGMGASEVIQLVKFRKELADSNAPWSFTWDVIPGVSSCIAVPETVGIPLTHKGVSNGFIVLSGHSSSFTSASEWVGLPSDPSQITLVVLMCKRNLNRIGAFLVNDRGWSSELPCVVVRNGTMGASKSWGERVWECRLGELQTLSVREEAESEGNEEAAPMMLIVGNACAVLRGGPTPTWPRSRTGDETTSRWSSARLPNTQQTKHTTSISPASPETYRVFGYGSLIWRPNIPGVVETADGYIEGYVRRFYQLSPDHRGTPEARGRVVTLLHTARPTDVVYGRVYTIHPAHVEEVKARLEQREIAGYETETVEVHLGGGGSVRAHVFIAGAHNENFHEERDVAILAETICRSVGPSGTNLEYFRELVGSMRAMRALHPSHSTLDEHIVEIEKHVEIKMTTTTTRE